MQRVIITLACVCIITGAAWSQDRSNTVPEAKGSPTQIEQLQRELDELRHEYGSRIADLETRIEELSASEGSEPDPLPETADVEERVQEEDLTAEDETADGTAPEATEYSAGALSLQALNPEISVTGDTVAFCGDVGNGGRSAKSEFRCLGVHLESYLDPYSRFKAALPFTGEGAHLEEAYLTRYDVGKGLNLTLGKFQQQFGVVGRWHEHALDQVDFPLPLRQIFGGPLNQTGVSLDWMLPRAGNAFQEVTLQITNGENDRLFGGNTENFPAALVHYKNYRDLSKDKYLEFGLTALAGRNDEWQVRQDGGDIVTQSDDLWTVAFGADFTLLWEPTAAMRYRNWVWRTELYCLMKDLLSPNGSGKDRLRAWGAYSYFQRKLSRTLDAGIRLDYYHPDTKAYADVPGLSLYPLAVSEHGAHQWQISPYLTWEQSPWVRWRLQYDRLQSIGMGSDEDRLSLQCVFAAGPHKHERY